MNCKEHQLPELELSTAQKAQRRDRQDLTTFLSIRSPGPVTPREVDCEGFDVTYTRIATNSRPSSQRAPSSGSSPSYSLENDVDRKVDDAIESFLRSLTQIGPELLSVSDTWSRATIPFFFAAIFLADDFELPVSLTEYYVVRFQGCLTLSFFERRASRQLFGLVSHEERVVWEQWILRVVVNNTPRPISNDSAAVIERQRIQNTAESMLRGALKCVFEVVGGPIDHVPPVMYEFEINCTKRPDDRENMMARVTNLPPILNLS